MVQRGILVAFALLAMRGAAPAPQARGGILDVRDFGAKGDGANLDSAAINAAIEAAAARGGGTVFLPAGTYRSVSIRLRSDVSLYLDAGAVLLASPRGPGAEYDPAEPNPNDRYQDSGHSHFHNSLIWGERLRNVSILGRGEIDGKGLVHDFTRVATDGNKAIALRECRNVALKDVTIRHGGWFGILATGVDGLTIDGLRIDTERDGMDIDCCRDVHVTGCSVNSPNDDGICLKSSFALGAARATEDVTIADCHVSGFDEGTLLDGTFGRKGYPTGRIKFGTESNGGFKNVAISNCVFDHSRGLALETVDGGDLEDVTISNLTMRDIVNAPIFLRLARRMRGPEGTPVGHLRRVSISNVRVVGAREPSVLTGVPDHPIEGVTLSGIRVESVGGAKASQADVTPKEDERGYPEPGSLGPMPAHGFYVRHAKGIEFHDVEARTASDDGRPPFALDDVDDADFFRIKASRTGPLMRLTDVRALRVRSADGLRDTERKAVPKGSL